MTAGFGVGVVVEEAVVGLYRVGWLVGVGLYRCWLVTRPRP